MKNKLLCILLVVAMLFSLVSCGEKADITIIDGDFAEMKFFTQIAKIMIEENTDLKVEVQDPIASNLAFEQIKSGKMDIYMSYDGSLLTTYLGLDVSEIPEGMSLYDYTNEKSKEMANVMLLGKLGNENTYAIAVRGDTADKYNLKKISDLENIASELTFAAEHEFFDEGSKHYDSFVKYYDLKFKEANTIDRGLKYTAIVFENMDVTLVYSTDGLNKKFELSILDDDKGFFPEYNGAFLARADLYQDYPELEAVFEKLIGHFDNEKCIEMNYRIDVLGEEPYDVAYEFLSNEGLI